MLVNFDVNAQQIQTTKKFLHLISSHLSSRKGLKGKQYVCVICANYAVLKPNVLVFRNTHDRRPYTRVMVENHVLLDHMSDILEDVRPVGDNIVIFKRMSMVPGTYVYRPALHSKIRRWEKCAV